MEPEANKKSQSEPLLEDEGRISQAYGRLPRGALRGQQSKGRTYFDSGDFAVPAAGSVTDNGAIRTGTAHPLREGISRPHAPVPNASNVDDDANENLRDKKSGDFNLETSPLHRKTDQNEKTGNSHV